MNSDRNTLQLIKGSRLIDGRGGPCIEQGAVLVEGTSIIQVGTNSSIAIPEGVKVTEHSFPECTVLPGLIDTHTHINMPGDGQDPLKVMLEPYDILLLRSARNARIALQSGVTTLRDNGGRKRTTSSLREAIKMGVEMGPRLNLCGSPLTITGGHCWPMGGEADGVDGVRKAVRRAIKEGADYIKVMATGGSTLNTFPFLPSYTLEELRAIADEAHRFGKPTGAHCLCSAGIEYALEAGFDMLIHCLPGEPDGSWKPRPDLAEKIAKAGVWVNPTIHVQRNRYWFLCDMREKEGPSPKLDAELAWQKGKWEFARENLRQMRKAGVKMVAGGDTGWFNMKFGEFVYEIEHFHLDGFSRMEAILSATRDAAKSLGMEDIVGTLEPRKEADILVIEGDPLKDLMNLMKVKAVFKAGERIC